MTALVDPDAVELVRKCPGCGGQRASTDGPDGREFTTEISGRQFRQPDYNIQRCAECGLVYKSAILSQRLLAEYYRLADYRRWEMDGLFPHERRLLTTLQQLPTRSRILDLGCSSGRLLSRLTHKHECYGIEVNSNAAAVAAGKGITMLDPRWWQEQNPELTFHAVLLVDVFEHLSDPVATLADVCARLVDGGKLILCTGNADAPALRQNLANSWYFRNVEHLIMLTRRFAHHLADRLGLVVTEWKQVSHYDSTRYQRLRQACQVFIYDAVHLNRPAWYLPILRSLPVWRRGLRWSSRPVRNLTADHVIAVFKRGSRAP